MNGSLNKERSVMIDVLNLEWSSSPSRDRAMATLVCNYLRFQGLKVVEGCLHNGCYLIHKFKPKLVFISNSIGAPENLFVTKYAKSLGCIVITLVSEGNFREEPECLPGMIWGWNKEQFLHEDIQLHWSHRTRDLTLKQHPELADKIKVSGGVGFDNYLFNDHETRSVFLRRFKKTQFNKIVGVGLWDFGLCYKADTRYEQMTQLLSADQIDRFINDGLNFNNILCEVIKDNSDILFVLKQHPGIQLGSLASAIQGVEKFQNVLILQNEVSISDCIAVTDLWMVYESTTALEAWLLGKKTVLLNPSGRYFPRDIVNVGSPDIATANDLQSTLYNFYHSGDLEGFAERLPLRNKIIESVIQWADGLNHVRAGNQVIDALNRIPNKSLQYKKISYKLYLMGLRQTYNWCIRRLLKKIGVNGSFNRHAQLWSEMQLQHYAAQKMATQIAYYKKNKLDAPMLRKVESE